MAERARIFVSDTLPVEARELLAGYDVFEKEADDQTLARCEVLMAWPSRARAELLRKMTSLKMVQSMSAGVDALDFGSLPPGVAVFSNAGAFTESVAEHAWGLLLGVAKGVHVRNQKVVPMKLKRKALLVVGCGSIGSEIARLSRSLEMKTIGVSRSFKAPEVFDEKHPISELLEVVGKADAVAIALPMTKLTQGLIGSEVLGRMKDPVVVVNVGRGEVVDEESLMEWLRSRPSSRYATDVFWKKDGRENFGTEGWSLPNFAGTLHISGLPVGETLEGAKLEAARNVRRFLVGGDPHNRVARDEYE
jgi:D-3-phosphoglycerate dehydrogenase